MTAASALVWALWVTAGGPVNSGMLTQPYVAAYFPTKEACVQVQAQVNDQTRWSKCIQATYIIHGGVK